MYTALINGSILNGREIITGKDLLLTGGKISGIKESGSYPEATKIVNCHGNYIAPGLIDLQIAGSGGYLFSDSPSAEKLATITESIVKSGTTGFLIVLPTNTFDVYSKAFRIVRENPHPALLGLHLEGPYLNPERPGAHDRSLIRKPGLREIDDLLKEANGVVKMITIAPEICDAEFIRFLGSHGIIVAAGHSNATFREAVAGFANGVRSVTHLFNAMSQLHHRDPGLPGAAFVTENVYASIIADGIHVDYNMLSIAKKIMSERLYLVSDAVEESSEGSYRHVRQADRYTLPDGTLSGSGLTMMKAVKNCVENADIKVDEAMRMASGYSAKLMNFNDRGLIVPGYRADIIEFDNKFELKRIFISGEEVK